MNTITHDSGNGRSNGNGSGPRHPIGVVSRRTGLSIHVLRAWERRYGVVTPGRTPGRQRLYTESDVTRLRLLRQATETGRTIGQVARLSTPELIALLGDADGSQDGEESEEEDESSATVAACLRAAESLDDEEVQRVLRRAVVRLRPQQFVTEVVGPTLRRAGELWHDGRWRPAHEHLVSENVRRVLQWMFASYTPDGRAPLVLCSTVAGERHELGAMLAAVVALDEGWRVQFLGPDLPANDIAYAAAACGADVVAVGVQYANGDARPADEVRALKAALPPSTVLLVGGRGVTEFVERTARAVGASVVENLDAFRRTLRALAEHPESGKRITA